MRAPPTNASRFLRRSPMPRRIGGNAIAGAATLVILLVLAFAQSARDGKVPVSAPSSYDTGRYGYRAFYELLKRERLAPRRFRRDHHFLNGEDGTLVVAQSVFDALAQRNAGIGKNDVLAIKLWVQRGGHAIILAPPYGSELDTLLGIPASRPMRRRQTAAYPFAAMPETRGVRAVSGAYAHEFARHSARKAVPLLATRSGIVAMRYHLGRGTLTVFTDPFSFSNEHLAQDGNARFAVQLLSAHPGGIAFDETIHGYGASQSLWEALPWTVQWGAVLFGVALILGIAGNVIRFAPPATLERVDERDSSAYITSMANLFMHARAKEKTLRDVAASALRGVRRNFGVAERTPVKVLLARIGDPGQRNQVLELDRLCDLRDPSDSELLRAGALAAHLRKETGT